METYTKQFDKLTAAYMSGEVNPMSASKCFVGNMLGHREWFGMVHNRKWRELDKLGTMQGYKISELRRIEAAFMSEINGWVWLTKWASPRLQKNYEESLFRAFCRGLEELKKVHEEHDRMTEVRVFRNRVTNQLITIQ